MTGLVTQTTAYAILDATRYNEAFLNVLWLNTVNARAE